MRSCENIRWASFVFIVYSIARSTNSFDVLVGSASTLDSSFVIYTRSNRIPMVSQLRMPTLLRYFSLGSGSNPLIIFLSVLPGVNTGPSCWGINWSADAILSVNDVTAKVISPFLGLVISKPRKSLGGLNLHWKYFANSSFNFFTAIGWPS